MTKSSFTLLEVARLSPRSTKWYICEHHVSQCLQVALATLLVYIIENDEKGFSTKSLNSFPCVPHTGVLLVVFGRLQDRANDLVCNIIRDLGGVCYYCCIVTIVNTNTSMSVLAFSHDIDHAQVPGIGRVCTQVQQLKAGGEHPLGRFTRSWRRP